MATAMTCVLGRAMAGAELGTAGTHHPVLSLWTRREAARPVRDCEAGGRGTDLTNRFQGTALPHPGIWSFADIFQEQCIGSDGSMERAGTGAEGYPFPHD